MRRNAGMSGRLDLLHYEAKIPRITKHDSYQIIKKKKWQNSIDFDFPETAVVKRQRPGDELYNKNTS
jgi:hypothetical protein